MHRIVATTIVLLAASVQANASAQNYFTEFAKDFGVTPRGPVLTHYFLIRNTTPNTLTLGTARVSCGCVSATVLKNVLAPGETTAVAAMMDTRRIPQAYVTKTVIVYVPFLSPTLEEVSLRVSAIARDDLVYSPNDLNFGTVKKGKAANTTLKVTLFNHPQFEITSVTSSGQFVKVESKLAARQGAEVSYDIVATLDPACPVGNWISDVTLKTNIPGIDSLKIPVNVNVTAPIAVTPGEVKLADVKMETGTEFKVLLQSTTPFKIEGVKGGDEIVSAKAEATDSRTTHTIVINVKPKTKVDVARTLEISTDNKEMPKISVPFKATVAK